MGLKDFLNFEKFLTPSLVKIVYWIGIIAITISTAGAFFTSFSSFGGGLRVALGSIVAFVVGIIFWRVLCEGIMLSFRIYDRLTEIKDRLPRS